MDVEHRPGQMIDCVVVGAGPGLATSGALTARGVEHVVLDSGRAGHTWRTQRSSTRPSSD